LRVRFLGTGASGGTPGRGRSRRLESSAVIGTDPRLLIDVTRDFAQQGAALARIDAALLTHAHRDAAGGIPALGRWSRERKLEPIAVYSHPRTLAKLRARYARLQHCRLIAVEPGEAFQVDEVEVSAVEVPHAADPRFPTFAWRLRSGGVTVVYASDVAQLTVDLEQFARGASLLVLDGAMWGRTLFSHLRVDRDLPVACRWDVGRILLTQIGRTAPPHKRFEREVRSLCARATPAHDGLELRVGATRARVPPERFG
jgi:phosphoribosyl 1,2-cyclic phosphodiesterase